MKLLVVSHPCVTAVNQTLFADLQALTKWKLTLLTPSRWRTEYGKDELIPCKWKGLNADLDTIPVFFSGNVPLHVYRSNIASYLKRVNPDAIYVHNEPYALGTSQIYLANRMTCQCPLGFYTAQNIRKLYPFPFNRLESWVYQASSFALPVTEGALSVIRDKGYDGPAEVIPLALDQGVYRPLPDSAQMKRKELGIDPRETVIGYVGRLVEEKGIETILNALPHLADRQYRCLIIGSGPDEGRLRRIVAELDLAEKVTFLGYIPHLDTPVWLSAIDICVLPSRTRQNWKEQFGRVILESVACGGTVIGSDSGEIPSVLRQIGHSSQVFAEGNAEDLAEKLKALHDDPGYRAALVSAGQAKIRERFGQHRIVSAFASEIELAARRTKKWPSK